MKSRKFFMPACYLFLVAGLFSCSKENSCENCNVGPGNKPPIAKAGPDQVITLPADSASLNGSASLDPDGTISSYSWSKISGPAALAFNSPTSSITVVRNLVPGIYSFELLVRDNAGASGRDTIQISVMVSAPGNRPPVAVAGPDQAMILPVNSAFLEGNGSTDPDNNIVSYLWTRIQGPSSFLITAVTPTQVQATNLEAGIHLFELKVIDAFGLFSTDTILVAINPAIPACGAGRPEFNAQLIPFGRLSVPRILVTIATAGNKILFAGGQFDNGAEFQTTDIVDIYDMLTQTWTTARLSSPRYSIASITVGNKIYFAGGRSNWLGNLGWEQFKIVDIYDASTNTWSTDQLSSSRTALSIEMIGNKILFAGGRDETNIVVSPTVDILDLNSNTWSRSNLSLGRSDMASAVLNNKVYFAGGNTSWGPINGTHNASKRIDIYDISSNTWSTNSLSEVRSNFTGIEWAGNILFAGSENYVTGIPNTKSSTVEIWDGTGPTQFSCLFQPNSWFDAVIHNNKVLFFTGGGAWSAGGADHSRFDLYDPATNSWSIGKLGRELSHTGILNTLNITFIAGGFDNGILSDQVWRLQF